MNSLNGDGDSLDEANSLDHVLLESLFYNEMALMDDFSNSLFSASMMNGFSASSDTDGSVGSTTLQDNGVPQVALVPEDPKVDVEKDLLRDFGIAHPIVAPSVVQNPPPPTEASPSRKVPFVPPPIDKVQQQLNLKLASSRGIRHNVTVPLATPLQQQQQQQHQQPALAAAPPRPPPVSEEEMRKKLVIQFATLAGRLGITLPPQVVQKLTNKVVTGIAVPATLSVAPPDAMATAITLAPVPSSTVPSPTVTTSAVASLSAVAPPVAPPVIQQLQSTAVEAIAVVSGKRAAFAVEDGKPYSKRRKKPRLSDCERKLAELQAENSLLKSHLDNIANQNHNLDQERIKAETQMRAMLQESAPDAQLDPVVQNFTEMYSDYGRKRHEELNFHLEQLQRCVCITCPSIRF